MNENQKAFLTYVKTLQIFANRIRTESEDLKPVFISVDEIEKRFFKYNRKSEIQYLIDCGYLVVTSEPINNGKFKYLYDAPHHKQYNLDLIEKAPLPNTRLVKQTLKHLQNTSLEPGAGSTKYFSLFQKWKNERTDLFLNVDDFSGRIHTPISNFHRIYRPGLKLYGNDTVGLDVFQMQPTLLGKILQDKVGNNEFSTWIDQGIDVYEIIKNREKLETRDDAKKRMFKILFGYPDNKLKEIFGDANWINWINEYKSKPEPLNKKLKYNSSHKISYHNNLSWLLQTTEVQTMTKVWNELIDTGIPFLGVHDEIIIEKHNEIEAYKIFWHVLKNELNYFKINNKALKDKTEPINQLHKIAMLTVPDEANFSVQQIINRIQVLTNVPEQRAINGFTKMLDSGMIEVLPNSNYCISGGVPF
jgi:hypothetical protein